MKQLWYLAESVTPAENTAEFNQAMMDLGAMVCLQSRPKCEACPLKKICASYLHHSQADFPQKKPVRAKPHKRTLMLLHRHQDQVLLWRRPPSGIWGGLWSLPEVDGLAAVELWQECFLSLLQAPKMVQQDVIRHQFTHFSLDISLAIIEMEQLPQQIFDNDNYAWVDIDALSSHGMPTPVRKLLVSLDDKE